MIDKTTGNFNAVATGQGKYPIDSETFETLQKNTAQIAALGASMGRKCVILTGCTKNGGQRTKGYVYVQMTDEGEVLHYPGGNYNETYCHIDSTDTEITALGEPFAAAYTVRTLANGRHPTDAAQTLEWKDFVKGSDIFAQKKHNHTVEDVEGLKKLLDALEGVATDDTDLNLLKTAIEKDVKAWKEDVDKSMKALEDDVDKDIEKLQKNIDKEVSERKKAVSSSAVTFVKGMVMIWTRPISEIPQGWHLCDGTHGTKDLRGMFVICAEEDKGAGDKFYVGEKYGSEFQTASIRLSSADIPAHRHQFIGDKNIGNSLTRISEIFTCSGEGKGGGAWYLTGHEVFPKNGQTYQDKETTLVKSESFRTMPLSYAFAYIEYIGV